MTIGSRVLARLAGLPPAFTHDVGVERDFGVPMADGVVLLADRYFPRGGGNPPIVLLRTPYGPRQLFGALARVFAERGYQAVVQSVRGTFGSGGTFDPLRHEAGDGRCTLDWLAAQSWFSGSVAMMGPSYLGFVQWAVAAEAPAYLQALAPHITASQFRSVIYPGEAFALDVALSWAYLVHHQELPLWRVLWAQARQRTTLGPAFAHLPLADADCLAVGCPVSFFQDWLDHDRPGDPFWDEIDYRPRLDAVATPVNLVGGWYDLFLPDQLADYVALRQAGHHPQLTVGPWAHLDVRVLRVSLCETLAWFDAHLRGQASRLRASPVRVFVMGSNRWLDLPDWPPPAKPTCWYLQPDHVLAPEAPAWSPPDHYDYDPARPTPAVGGVVLGTHAGARDNRGLDRRRDVLVYTSTPLDHDVDVVGPVVAELYIRSSLEHTDVFARLCDVEPSGRSINICDGLVRLWPGRYAPSLDGTQCVRLDLWPTAYTFRRGHRLRLQISSGAHPRFSRNLGSGEPLATATTCQVAHQQVFHDATHPSALVLPVWTVHPVEGKGAASITGQGSEAGGRLP